jgi:hypothetical protein
MKQTPRQQLAAVSVKKQNSKFRTRRRGAHEEGARRRR